MWNKLREGEGKELRMGEGWKEVGGERAAECPVALGSSYAKCTCNIWLVMMGAGHWNGL